MSDTSRKRCRKSKIVFRECTEDDVELQVPAIKITKIESMLAPLPPNPEIKQNEPSTSAITAHNKSILRKLSASALKAKELESPIKFDIHIEVERNDELNDSHYPQNSPKNELQISAKQIPKENAAASSKPIVLTNKEILHAADEIKKKSKNPADRIVDVCFRNMIGVEKNGRQYTGHELNIQKVLEEWRSWQLKSTERDSPLFYKCYICEKSWWYLKDFRDHISGHKTVNLSLEPFEKHECNIIAYENLNEMQMLKEIYTEGRCYRCNKNYDTHTLKNRFNKKYANVGCDKQFYTCLELRDHIPNCKHCNCKDFVHKCSICLSSFSMGHLLTEHLKYSHAVRSDIPITVHYRNCGECLARFFCPNSHICMKKGPHFKCTHCIFSCPSKSDVTIHMDWSEIYPYKCEICGKKMKYNCQKGEHMLLHTNKYMLVHRCIKCHDFSIVFLDINDAKLHHCEEHAECLSPKIERYYPRIIIPKKCIYPNLQESDQENEIESMSELQESNQEKVVVKVEPQTSEEYESPIKIKSEPLEESDYSQDETNNYMTQIKEEYTSDNEYEDDIIKLNIDLNEHFKIKQESDIETVEFSDPDSTLESNLVIKEESCSETREIQGKQKKIYTCNRCDFQGMHKEYKEHIEYECIRNPLKTKLVHCTKCATDFASMKKYLTHFVNHGFKALSCPECLKQFFTFSKLIPHVQSHIKQNFVRVKIITQDGRSAMTPEFQCKICNMVVGHDTYFQHWELHVKDSPMNVVQQVSVKYPRLDTQISEEVINESLNCLKTLPKECNQCQRKFKRVNECKRHIIEHLLVDAYTQKHLFQVLKCQICDSGYHTADKYKQHMREHASLPLYKCELCDRSFGDSSNFTKHKKVHNLEVYICDLCGKKFQIKTSLEKHMEKHEESKPVTCSKCDKTFHFESTFRRHVRNFHEKPTVGFKCIICNERFASLKLKWNHLWEVHRERKNIADCPICLKSFRKYSDVRAHAKSEHNAEVSVYSVKKTSNKRVDLSKFVLERPQLKLNKQRQETLIVFE